MPVGKRNLRPCGTHAAYRRHARLGEECESCAEGMREYERQRPKRKQLPVTPEHRRRNNLMYKFGLTVVQFDTMCTQQNNCCAICSIAFSIKLKPCVDHDHTTGKIRALLCMKCNFMIGLAMEDSSILAAAMNYLDKHKGLQNG